MLSEIFDSRSNAAQMQSKRPDVLLNPWPHSLHQLVRHGRLHPEVVEEGLWVFDSELLHQSGVMSIQPPSLRCQPWARMI